MRLAFLVNIVPAYRKTFYEKLGSHFGSQWLLIKGTTDAEDGRPDFKGTLHVPQHTVSNRTRTLGPYTLRWQRGALGAVRSFKPDVIVVSGTPGNITNWLVCAWARFRRVPIVIWACGWDPQVQQSLAQRVKAIFARKFFGMADRCLLYSTKGLLNIEALGVDRGRLRVCYNGVETDDLATREKLIRCAGRDLRVASGAVNQRVLLYVGGMLPEKRIDLLLEAFFRASSDRHDFQLWLVGDGPSRGALEARVAELGLRNVRFWGRVIEDVERFFAAADAFVLPGVGGLAINQAMFWGCPCIVSEADGTEDDLVVDGVTGERFVPNDISTLSAAIVRSLSYPEAVLTRMRSEARRLIMSRSNVNVMVSTFITTLRELTEGETKTF